MVDSFQLWLAVFSIDTARYLMGAGGVSLVLFVLLRRFSATHRIQSRRARACDYRREILYSLLTTAVYATVALATVRLEQAGYLHYYGTGAGYPIGYTLLSLPLLLVLHDAYFYWVHRAMHHPWLFRRFHLVHHRSHTPTPWAAYAFAPGEAFLMALFVPLAAWLIPVHHAVLFLFLAIMIVRNAMGHAGVEFHPKSWVDGPFDCLTSVVHHDLHHQRARGNYGLYFTWWDRWMGTEFADYKARFRDAAQREPAVEEVVA
jgi:sterol desaturase/sphingolipid hydroxylase (fatty acid hydroxylase superfamily)